MAYCDMQGSSVTQRMKETAEWKIEAKKEKCESVESLSEGRVHFTNVLSVLYIDKLKRFYTVSLLQSDKLHDFPEKFLFL